MTINDINKYLDNSFLSSEHSNCIKYISGRVKWSEVSLDDLTKVNFKIREILRKNPKMTRENISDLKYVANQVIYPECLKKLRSRKEPIKDCKFYLGRLKDAVLALDDRCKSSASKNRAVQAAAKELTLFIKTNRLDFSLCSIPELHEFNNWINAIHEKHRDVIVEGGYHRYFFASETKKEMDAVLKMLKGQKPNLLGFVLGTLQEKHLRAELLQDLRGDRGEQFINVEVLNNRIIDAEHAVEVCSLLASQNPRLLCDYLRQTNFHFSDEQLKQIRAVLDENEHPRFDRIHQSLIEKNRIAAEQQISDQKIYGMHREIGFGCTHALINRENMSETATIDSRGRFLQAAANLDFNKKQEPWNFTEIGREILKNQDRYPIIIAKGRKLLAHRQDTHVEKMCHIYGREAVKFYLSISRCPSRKDYLAQLKFNQEEVASAFSKANNEEIINQIANERDQVKELCDANRQHSKEELQIPSRIAARQQLKKEVESTKKLPIKDFEKSVEDTNPLHRYAVHLYSEKAREVTFYISGDGEFADMAAGSLLFKNENNLAHALSLYIKDQYPLHDQFKLMAY